MRRVQVPWGLCGLLAIGLLSTHAIAQEPESPERETSTEGAAATPPVDKAGAAPSGEAPKAEKASTAPVAAAAAAPADSVPAKAPRPKVGDFSVSGYFRGGFGASNQKGRMTCFALTNPSGLKAKYRLGNECEVWSETHFTMVAYSGDDGVVATMHFMPTVYIPTTYIGYSPTGSTNPPDQNMTSTGAMVAFPTLYVDIQGIPWLGGGTAWMGTRYYKRESVYINDFFYWNPSGVGGGIEDIHLGKDLRLSYAVFAVDGQPGAPPAAALSPAPFPAQFDLGFRNDLQLRGIKPYASGEFQLGLQLIADYSDNTVTHGGWGATIQHVQKLLGGDNKLAFQYGRGGGTGFGTLARFYYPDFSIYFAPSEYRIRVVNVLTIQPVAWLGAQATFIYQHDDIGVEKTDWMSTGARVSYGFVKHAKLIGEVGYDHATKSKNDAPQWLAKFTIAPAITADRGLMSRPELRLFYTYAMWNENARTATVDSGSLYTATNLLSGATFGLQAETWW